jgi:hypothetical protein
MQIVGWYHSHPGFGVEFSEMDLFIHRNFFPGPGQIAYVTDPLGGMEAICVNLDGGIRELSRFWVDGRERSCRGPEPDVKAAGSMGADTIGLSALEARIAKVLQAIDEQNQALNRFLFGMAVLLAVAIVVATSYNIYRAYTRDYTPPELNSYVRVPVKLGERTVMIGLQVTDWELPPEVNAIIQEEVKQRLEAEAKAKQEAEAKAKQEAADKEKATNAPPGSPAGTQK